MHVHGRLGDLDPQRAVVGEGNSGLQGWGRALGMVGHCGKALLRSRWLKGALMPPSVAGLCPEPGSILIGAQR